MVVGRERLQTRWLRASGVVLCSALAMLLIAWGLRARAKPALAVRYISAVSGVDAGDCTTASAPCHTLQYVHDQADDGDELYLAAFDNFTPATYTSTASAVISLTKSLTIRGGYVYQHIISATWTPGLTPSVIDGEGSRRGAIIRGPVTPTLQFVTFINGNATLGGNVYAENASLNLTAVTLLSGTAQSGGGLYCKDCRSTLDLTSILSGNLPALTGLSSVQGNSAQLGGGLYLEGGNPAWIGLSIISNTATEGGGLYLKNTATYLIASSVLSNAASNGAGVYINGPLSINPLELPIIANTYLRHNHASGNGGGLNLQQAIAVLANTIIADNTAVNGAGAYLYASSPQGFYNTLANNQGTGLYVTHQPGSIFPPVLPLPSLPAFTNTLIISQSVGVNVNSTGLIYPLQNRLTLNGTLWWANGLNTSGAGEVISATNVFSNPLLTCTGDWPLCLNPYHLMDNSPAIDRGVNAVIPGLDRFIDIDGQLRPGGAGFDIGADEVPDPYGVFALPIESSGSIAPGATITYTHAVLNTGTHSDTFTLTLGSPTGYATLIEPAPIFLAAQTITSVQVRVSPPWTATTGVTDITHISITSWGDPSRTFTITDTTIISGGQRLYLPLILNQLGP